MAVFEVESYIDNYKEIEKQVNEVSDHKVKIISVSKAHPLQAMKNAYESGLRVFGENYVQEMVDKFEELDDNTKNEIEWHFIGHLQSNKVKYIAPFVDLIHSVHKPKLAKEINKRARQNDRIIDILLQINTSGEESKSGTNPDQAIEVIKKILEYENINLVGLMTISGLESSDEERREEFKLLREIRDNAESELKIKLPELSMGMTSDFKIAIEEGATMIRVGTAIFGERNYD